MPVIWPAPAKLNLSLHIVGRRPDGYHLLQTVFQFLDYGDELSFRVTDDGSITRARELTGVPAEIDLTLRAARLLQQATGCPAGAEITLTKRIPTGGGLGGGSSDAATTLLALNTLWRIQWPTAKLAALGLTLGADVPVFIEGQAALAKGVGEVLTPVNLPEPWYVVVAPTVQVSTADVFREFARERQLTPHTSARTIRDLRAGCGPNDLEPLVRRRYPEVERAFQALSRYGQPRMTGSGGCVFIEVVDDRQGKRVLTELSSGFTGFVARGMNRHPLYQPSMS
ncbi:MAG: 4-(cytidine 5'-diphospho)-2-C-methyl-D-erythritol kinase [Gammaproteobacteria bacterium]|nr:4-(cytidine 5'-diphospho)-2-C-methyl-D-erythritol kinase [Gammaproteobacteria bacterium]